MNHNTTKPNSASRVLSVLVLFGLLFSLLSMQGTYPANAQVEDSTSVTNNTLLANLSKDIILVPGTVESTPEINDATVQSLALSNVLLPESEYFTITDISDFDTWLFISVLGLNNVGDDLSWNLTDNAAWAGLVLLKNDNNFWSGSVEGTIEFSQMINEIPDEVLTSSAKNDLDPLQRELKGQSSYVFPWAPGTSMRYGQLGVHDNGFQTVTGGTMWKSVDFLSGYGISGEAPNDLRAAATGTVSYKCTPASDEVTTAIKINDLFYSHLINSTSIYVGKTYDQGSSIGSLKNGSFNEKCGYATQGASVFHVHLGFPNTGSVTFDGWTLNMSNELWSTGGETQGIGEWFQAGRSSVMVAIGGDPMGDYRMGFPSSKVQKYPVAGGPVVIRGEDGTPIIASMLQLRRQDVSGGWTGITQIMGIQKELIDTSYVFPRYHGTDPTKYQIIQIANYDYFNANVTVTIAGTPYGSFLVQPGSTFSFRDTSIDAGPVIVSSDGPRIIASLYELQRQRSSGKWTGQTQMLGVPLSQLSDTYIFPRYNNTLNDLDATLIFANLDTEPTEIIVEIGNDFSVSYTMPANTFRAEKYPVAGGPVVIRSENGTPIIASMLQLRRQDVSGGWTGITQLMGLQEELIGSTYVFPRYHGTDPTKYQTIQIANYDDTDANVTITIGGVSYGAHTVAPGETFIFRDTTIDAGPTIVSSDGPRIIASLYELQRQRSSGKWTGQTQMLGIPLSQLSDTYIFPRYNNTLNDLDATLIFAVP